MTRDEFEIAMEPFLDLRTFEPFALVFEDGSYVPVDHPAEWHWEPSPRIVRRRIAEKIPIDESKIRAVVAQESLPTRPGVLSLGEFREKLDLFRWAVPFQPFEIILKDGRMISVEQPERLRIIGRFANVWNPVRMEQAISNENLLGVRTLGVPAHA